MTALTVHRRGISSSPSRHQCVKNVSKSINIELTISLSKLNNGSTNKQLIVLFFIDSNYVCYLIDAQYYIWSLFHDGETKYMFTAYFTNNFTKYNLSAKMNVVGSRVEKRLLPRFVFILGSFEVHIIHIYRFKLSLHNTYWLSHPSAQCLRPCSTCISYINNSRETAWFLHRVYLK
jgi:hypothetical protein